MNINRDLFRKFTPQNKLKMVQEASSQDLKQITYETLLKIVREAGHKKYSTTAFKRLNFRASNHWNATVVAIDEYKRGELSFDINIGGDSTDSCESYSVKDFIRYLNISTELCMGSFKETDKYNNTTIHDAYFDQVQRVEIVRNICIAYITHKYNIN